MTPWTKFTDAYPKEDAYYLVYCALVGEYFVASWMTEEGEWWSPARSLIHDDYCWWRELPDKPEGV